LGLAPTRVEMPQAPKGVGYTDGEGVCPSPSGVRSGEGADKG